MGSGVKRAGGGQLDIGLRWGYVHAGKSSSTESINSLNSTLILHNTFICKVNMAVRLNANH